MKRIGAVTGIVAAAAVILLATAAAKPASHHRIRAHARAAAAQMTESEIQSFALSTAASFGDPNPSLIQHVSGSQGELTQFLFGSDQPEPGTDPSLLIAEQGSFVANDASRLYASEPAPTGSVALFIIDQTTGQLTGYGITNTYPALASLGPVTTDSSSTAQSRELRTDLRVKSVRRRTRKR